MSAMVKRRPKHTEPHVVADVERRLTVLEEQLGTMRVREVSLDIPEDLEYSLVEERLRYLTDQLHVRQRRKDAE